MLETSDDAFYLLKELNADKVLLRHAELVYDVAKSLLTHFNDFKITLDSRIVLIGAILHDVGKTIHVEELHKSGHLHEGIGHELLLAKGIDEHIARICETHAHWDETTPPEDLIVALADKLWKGQRNAELEQLVIQRYAELTENEFWSIFIKLDTCFEEIAADGHDRLRRSRE